MFALIIQQGYYEDQMRSSISKRLKGLTTVHCGVLLSHQSREVTPE